MKCYWVLLSCWMFRRALLLGLDWEMEIGFYLVLPGLPMCQRRFWLDSLEFHVSFHEASIPMGRIPRHPIGPARTQPEPTYPKRKKNPISTRCQPGGKPSKPRRRSLFFQKKRPSMRTSFSVNGAPDLGAHCGTWRPKKNHLIPKLGKTHDRRGLAVKKPSKTQ